MTRFWMVQHLMVWIYLLLAAIFDWSPWAFAVAALGFLFTGYQFARSAQRDDKRKRAQCQVHNIIVKSVSA